MPNNKIQSLTVNGVTYDIVDNTSGYINAQYIENKTDYSIPVSRVGEIVVGETAIGTDSTNFPTSKAVVDYVDERVVQEIDAIDVGVTGIKANGTSLSVENGVVNIPVIGPNQSVGLMTNEYMIDIYDYIDNISYSIPTSTSQLTNDSGFITSETDPTVPSWAKASTKPTYTAAEVGALPDTTTIPSKTSDLTNDSGFITSYTDEKLKVNSNNLTENTGYFPILTTATSTAETKIYNNQAIKVSYDGSKYTFTIGATSSQGVLKLFSGDSSSLHYTILQANSISATRTITLPNATGTVALTSDIPQVYSSTNTGGYLTMATLPIYDGTVV